MNAGLFLMRETDDCISGSKAWRTSETFIDLQGQIQPVHVGRHIEGDPSVEVHTATRLARANSGDKFSTAREHFLFGSNKDCTGIRTVSRDARIVDCRGRLGIQVVHFAGQSRVLDPSDLLLAVRPVSGVDK
jgi:hypothetical protein